MAVDEYGPRAFLFGGTGRKIGPAIEADPLFPALFKKPDFAYSFLFLGRTLVTYINRRRKDTFGADGVLPVRCSLYDPKGLMAEIEGGVIRAPYAELVREGLVDRIEVDLR